jgi:Flp pilus assembly protein TadG
VSGARSERVARRRPPEERGQSLIEFAIVLPMVMLLLFGALDLGRGVFTYNTLAQAAREANRVAIVNQTESAVKARAIGSAATLGLTTSNVQVCYKRGTSTQAGCGSTTDDCPPATRSVGCLAIVTVSVTYAPMTPLMSLLWNSISISSTSVAPVEYVCPDHPATTCP